MRSRIRVFAPIDLLFGELKLLERLAAEGKPTRLTPEEIEVAESPEMDGLLFIVVRDVNAVITTKGRHAPCKRGAAEGARQKATVRLSGVNGIDEGASIRPEGDQALSERRPLAVPRLEREVHPIEAAKRD